MKPTKKAPAAPPPPATQENLADRDHGSETGIAPLTVGEIAATPATQILAGYTFTPASAAEYVRNIRQLAERTHAAQRESVCATVLLGRYLRDVGHDLKSKGKGEFGAWLKENIPGVPYSALATAMRIAADLAQKHPELRHIDTAEKVDQLTLLIDGKSLTAFGRSLREEDEGEERRETKKGPAFAPKPKSPAEKADEARAEARINFLEAVKALESELKQGNAGALRDEEFDEVIGALEDMQLKLRELRDARKAATETTNPKRRRRDVTDL